MDSHNRSECLTDLRWRQIICISQTRGLDVLAVANRNFLLVCSTKEEAVLKDLVSADRLGEGLLNGPSNPASSSLAPPQRSHASGYLVQVNRPFYIDNLDHNGC